jgi:beta-glucosidase
MWVNAELNASNAFVAAWLPGSEGKAIADVLLLDKNNNVEHDFKGKLSFSWPISPTQIVNRFDKDNQALFAYGFGLTYKDDDTLADDLSEISDVMVNTKQASDIFLGQAIAPWEMLLVSQEQTTKIDSNSKVLPGISYRTVDKEVQEDSFRLETSGTANSGVKFITDNGFREDLSAELERNAFLTFSVKRDSKVNQPVYVSMSCETIGDTQASCQASVDIQEQLASIPLGEWKELSINLHCFADKGVQLNKVAVPFEFRTLGKLNLSINHIRLAPSKIEDTSLNCL